MVGFLKNSSRARDPRNSENAVRPPYIPVFLRKRLFTSVHIRPEDLQSNMASPCKKKSLKISNHCHQLAKPVKSPLLINSWAYTSTWNSLFQVSNVESINSIVSYEMCRTHSQQFKLMEDLRRLLQILGYVTQLKFQQLFK